MDAGIEVLGISFDSVEENKAFADKFDFPFRLLSDIERRVGLSYGACRSPDDAHAQRLTYVIGTDGSIERAIDTQDPAGQAEDILSGL